MIKSEFLKLKKKGRLEIKLWSKQQKMIVAIVICTALMIVGNEDGWLRFFGVILQSLLSFSGTLYVMEAQIDREQQKRDKERSSLLVLGKGAPVNISTGKNITIPIINAGATAVVGMEVHYSLTEQFIANISKKNTQDKEDLFINLFNSRDTRQSCVRRKCELQYFPVLMPSETQNINLGVNIWHSVVAYIQKMGDENLIVDDSNMKLKIILKYQDYKGEQIVNEYLVNIKLSYYTTGATEVCCHAETTNISNPIRL